MAIDRKRRKFLKTSAGIGFGALFLEAGCGPSDKPDLPPDEKPPKPPSKEKLELGAVQKGPFIQYIDRATARLRFETILDEDVPVLIERNGESTEEIPDRIAENLSYTRSDISRSPTIPDKEGLHVLHTLLVEDLQPGEEITYHLLHDNDEHDTITGTLSGPPGKGTAFQLGWIADTMYPTNEGSIDTLCAKKPDLVLHGGDIVYDTNPFDTWNHCFARLQPVLRRSAMHFNVGNHEFEQQNEIVVQFDRLFAGQGLGSHIVDGEDQSYDAFDRPRRYHSFFYGGVLFLCLDTESRVPEEEDYIDGELIEEDSEGVRELIDENSQQIHWLDDQLAAAQADPDVEHIVVSFHRPLFTWSKYGMRSDSLALRDALHPRFVDAGVSLVLAGHVHAFEFFEVDGIPYVVDGGGGALRVDPDEKKDEVLASRPEEEDLRKIGDSSFGITTVDFDGEGGFHIQRLRTDDPDTPLFEISYDWPQCNRPMRRCTSAACIAKNAG